MKTALEQIVKAVLYEGYILYPYRASSKKNQRERFTFGRVYPQIYSEKENGAESCAMQTECLFQTKKNFPKLKITLGFLQPMKREIGALEKALPKLPENEVVEFRTVPQLEVNGKIFQTWTEAIERKVSTELEKSESREIPFSFPANENREPIYNENGNIAGIILRRQELLQGKIEIGISPPKNDLFKISARVLNLSPVESADLEDSEKVLRQTFASTHFVLEIENGEFISSLETPPEFKDFADECKNIGCWPVLVGDENTRNAILASPIILYDYPKIAPESTGDFFDGTEIDEMLTLRVLTMTDEEKREMSVDDFSRRILERTNSLTSENFLKLHGKVGQASCLPVHRENHLSNEQAGNLLHYNSTEHFFNPAQRIETVSVNGVELKAGDSVLIRPKRRADAMDLLLAGKAAIIEAVEQDAEDKIHLALVLENDPGREFGLARQSGHRFFYGVDEVEPLNKEICA